MKLRLTQQASGFWSHFTRRLLPVSGDQASIQISAALGTQPSRQVQPKSHARARMSLREWCFVKSSTVQVNFNMILQQVDRSVLQFIKQTGQSPLLPELPQFIVNQRSPTSKTYPKNSCLSGSKPLQRR